MSVCLAMMVKNEEANIAACIDSALPFIDGWVILDTGSTDRTMEIIREKLADVPGTLCESPFVNYGETRSKLMAIAHQWPADYLLLLDADMQVDYAGPMPELVSSVYDGIVRTGHLDYALPIFVRNDRLWRYEGVRHSYLACDDNWNSEVLPGLRIIDGSHTTVEKLRVDLEMLSAEHARNPLDARTAFYLAQTYYDLDMIPEAIQAYRTRANMPGWDEETYYARYRLGALLAEHVDGLEGMRELLAAYAMRPTRVEALRVLANVATNVADKKPKPADLLFVHHAAYKEQPKPVPPVPSLDPGLRRVARRINGVLRPRDVSAVIVTRGDVDLAPILDTLPYDDVVVWNNAERKHDYKVYGRYAAIPETKNPVIYWQDDDVIFTEHARLLAAYEPGKVVANMDQEWLDGAGYGDALVLMGAGSLCDAGLPAYVFAEYLRKFPFDDELLVEADFAFGTLAPRVRVDLGYTTRPFTDNADRLYQQPGQTERKWNMIDRCRKLAA